MDNLYGVNTEEPRVMWIDLNSAFATAEQQAHCSLRGRPVGVTNRISKECCVIAASYEAKGMGVRVGMRRSEALAVCPELVLLETDPPRYHHVYCKLLRIMQDYTPDCKMKSIDEGILDFHGTPLAGVEELTRVGREIKRRVREEIGDYTRINVGIGTNRFLAKVAAGLHKPDGLDAIWWRNLEEVYSGLELEDLTGIAARFGYRLRSCGINTPLEFLAAREDVLRRMVFKGIVGTYWYRRLRGFEIDDYKTRLGMVGRQWVVGRRTSDADYLRSCLHYLTETVGLKLRSKGCGARGVCVWMGSYGGEGFHEKKMYGTACYTDRDIWRRVEELFERRPKGYVPKIMGVYLYRLEASGRDQLSLLENTARDDVFTEAVDGLNERYGIFTVHAADSLVGTTQIRQKIPFGGTEYFDLLLKRG